MLPDPENRLITICEIFLCWCFLAYPSIFGATDQGLRDRILDGDNSALIEAQSLEDEDRFDTYLSCLYSLARLSLLRERFPDLIDELTDSILAIDGHAKLFSRKIESLGVGTNSKRDGLFKAASYLKSPEMIEVVSSFLNDDRVFDDEDADVVVSGVSSVRNSRYAAMALGTMNLPDSPFPDKNPLFYSHEDVLGWRVWAREAERFSGKMEMAPNNGSIEQNAATVADGGSPDPSSLVRPESSRWMIWISLLSSVVVIASVLVIRRRTSKRKKG